MPNFKYQITNLILLGILCFVFIYPNQGFAQAATKSASVKPSPSLSPSPASRGALLDKLEGLKKEAASIAANIKKEIDQKIQNKAYIGTIQSKSAERLVVLTKSGAKTVLIDEYTSFLIKGKKASSKDFDEKDIVASLGDLDDKGSQHGKRIIMLSAPISAPKEVIWGQIGTLGDASVIINTKDMQKFTLNLSNKTIYQAGAIEASSSAMKAAKYVVAAGEKHKNGSLNATFVYILPTAGVVRSDSLKTASPSAKASSSPKASASPKPSPSATIKR